MAGERCAEDGATTSFSVATAYWSNRFAGKAPNYPGTAYVLLHSLSHALMSEIALDCGYPASSLKERVYALSGDRGARRAASAS